MYTVFYSKESNIKVALIADEILTKSIANLLVPYILSTESLEPLKDIWTVRIVNKDTVVLNENATEVTIHPNGEPEYKVVVLGYKKEIQLVSVQKCNPIWDIQTGNRLIRKLFRIQYHELGNLFLHGGMVQINGYGIAIVGKKKAGKTSTILSMLSRPELSVSFICNDDLIVSESEKYWTGLGSPRAISVRNDTLTATNTKLTNINTNHPSNTYGKTDNITLFYPKELSSLFNKQIMSQSTVHFIVFPKFLPFDQQGAILKRLTPDEALKELLCNLEEAPGKYTDFLNEFFDMPNVEKRMIKLRKLVTEIPCYQLWQSFGSLNEGTDALIDEIKKKNYEWVDIS